MKYILTTFLGILSLALGPAHSNDVDLTVEARAAAESRLLIGKEIDQSDAAAMARVNVEVAGELHRCGGAFLGPTKDGAQLVWSTPTGKPRWVLTAAHCVVIDRKTIEPGRVTVKSGIPGEKEKVAEETQDVIAIIAHPLFDTKTLENDLALLVLEEARANFQLDLRKTIQLPSRSNIAWLVRPFGALALQGTREETDGDRDFAVVEINLPVVARDDCVAAHGAFGLPPRKGQVCVGFFGTSYDPCQANGGSPAIRKASVLTQSSSGLSSDILMGIMSWSPACGKSGLFALVTSTAYYIDWIEEAVAQCLSKGDLSLCHVGQSF